MALLVDKRTAKGKVVVGMSGGVDSSVAAAILKKSGYDVIGVTFRMWPKEECGTSFRKACCSLEAITMARVVAESIGIAYYVMDLSAEFKSSVIDYFCAGYLKGLTPNPCVICNERIKFGALLDKARSLGAERVATGHYARVQADKRKNRMLLKCGKDKLKDQSYFLFSLSQRQLESAIFPLGGLTKEGVRTKARRLKLRTHDAVSSQDICFVQDSDYAEYIKKKTGAAMEAGDIVDGGGGILGRHKGIPFYTIGQRRGLGIAYKEPLYVTGIDVKRNRIVVGTKSDVLKKSFTADRLNWVALPGIAKPIRVATKIRYNHKAAKATVTKITDGAVRVDFDAPQEAPTPGQAVVFYDRDTVVGGGWIREAL